MSTEPSPHLSIIVPAYNEEKRITDTLQKIDTFFAQAGLSYEIIVVDDGSQDRTATVVKNLDLSALRLLGYGGNRGKGFAVNYGVKRSRGQWLLMTDADNSTPIEEFDKLWRQTTRAEVIIGSRYLKSSQIVVKQDYSRVVLSRLGNVLVQLLILPGIRDSQCGFKLFSRASADKIFSRQTIWRWGFDMEILRIAREQGYKIREIPIVWYNDTQSKIQSRRVFIKTLLELLTIRRNSWRGLYRARP